MLCPSCNNFRPANNASCPLCKAPSPLVNDGWGGNNASFSGNAWGNQSQDQANFATSWGNPGGTGTGPLNNNWNNSVPSGQLPITSNNWGDPAASGVQQMGFPTVGQQQGNNNSSFWSQVEPQPAQDAAAGQSMLPVPYQAQAQPGSQALMVMPNGFPTIGAGLQAANPLLPALPDSSQEPAVYVAPMYTKPRPIIPRYLAISGLISFI